MYKPPFIRQFVAGVVAVHVTLPGDPFAQFYVCFLKLMDLASKQSFVLFVFDMLSEAFFLILQL